jgi:hypothetical protein
MGFQEMIGRMWTGFDFGRGKSKVLFNIVKQLQNHKENKNTRNRKRRQGHYTGLFISP